MKVLVLTSAYPSNTDVYSNAFVHNRLVSYEKKNNDIHFDVCVCNSKSNNREYDYCGFRVKEYDKNKLKKLLESSYYDKIIIHFLTKSMIDVLIDLDITENVLVWVHGEEALSWKTRLFNWKQKKFLKYVLSNTIQLKKYKKFVNYSNSPKYIFVSNWMLEEAEKSIKTTFSNYQIIPNGIDTDFFSFKEKNNKKIKVLLIRPFTSKKYATDIAIDAILKLSKLECFQKFEFTIYGKGPLMKKQTEKIIKFSNVKIYDKFLTRDELKEEYALHDVFLCPTRQDAQGVTMCEAMSSGLVPITSMNTAIPEFVSDRKSGFLTKNSTDIVSVFDYLSKNRGELNKMSKNAREEILSKCDLNKIEIEELNLITNVVKK